jgi:hypothetical protein
MRNQLGNSSKKQSERISPDDFFSSQKLRQSHQVLKACG